MLEPLVKLPANATVGVIGSGLSGLAFTYFLNKLRPDLSITVINPGKHTGGWINSWNSKDQNDAPVMIERGPRTLRSISDGTVIIMDTMKELGKADRIRYIEKSSDANKKFIVDPRDRLVRVPNSLPSLIKFFLNPVSKGLLPGVMLEWSRKPGDPSVRDESVHSLISRRFGNEFVSSNLMSAIFRGIYSDDVKTLSARKVLRPMLEDERKYGSFTKGALAMLSNPSKSGSLTPVLSQYQRIFKKDPIELEQLSKKLKKYAMMGFQGGLSTVPLSLREALDKQQNVKFIRGTVTSVVNNPNSKKIKVEYKDDSTPRSVTSTEFDHLRVTLVPRLLATLLEKHNNSLTMKLQKVQNNTVVLVSFYLPSKDVIPKKFRGFGYLVPESNPNPEKLLGVIFDSVVEKNFKPFIEPASGVRQEHKDYTKLTAMVGGYMLYDKNGECQVPSEKEAIERVKVCLKKHLGISDADLNEGMWVYTVADRAIPRFFVGIDDWSSDVVKQVQRDYDNRISLGGMVFSESMGLPDVLVDGFKDAVKLSQPEAE